jgi:hypothetical protein
MVASQTLTPGAADAVSTGSNLGLYTQPVARAPVASDNHGMDQGSQNQTSHPEEKYDGTSTVRPCDVLHM